MFFYYNAGLGTTGIHVCDAVGAFIAPRLDDVHLKRHLEYVWGCLEA